MSWPVLRLSGSPPRFRPRATWWHPRTPTCSWLKWGHFLDESDATKLYGKGYFEGGYYRSKGVYRPSQNCIMATESGGGKFLFVCEDDS